LHAAARRLVGRAIAPDPVRRCPDLVSGVAGRILGLLALARALDDDRLVGDAVDDGQQLVAAARVTRHGWSWSDPTSEAARHLCGISHGAAGIGWALLELSAATGDTRFAAAGRGAFAYEGSWLDVASGTWPDLRIPRQRRGAPRAMTSAMMGTWCHGEAGIALSRLQAIAAAGSGEGDDDAEVALETTRRVLADAIPHEISDLSLCHGLAGAADVLLCAASVAGGRWRAAATLATDLGQAALERYDADRDPLPCGTPHGTTPSLFVGTSGIGWFFLRLYDDATNSPLLLRIG